MGGSKLKEFVNGYIMVRAESLNPEKFINMSARYGIGMWDIERINFTTIEFKMRYTQYRKLKTIINRTNSKTKIIKKHGVNFVLSKASRRKFFVLGIFTFIAIIFYLSSIVWILDISGNKKIDKQIVYDAVKNAGLKEGKIKYGVNLREIEANVLRQLDQVSVINIRLIGTKAKIEVVERTMPPSIIPTDKPANIVASKEGIITKVLSYKGQPTVKAGDYVRKNQILVSGIVTNGENVPLKIVHAMADITAKTWYEAIEEISLDYKQEVRTGNVKHKSYMNVLNKKIPTKNDNIDFKKYDKIEEKSMVKLRGREMPVEKVNEYYYEKIEVRKKLTTEEALNIAIEKAEDKVKNEIPKDAKVLDKKIEKNIEEGKVMVKLLYIAEEKIGLQMEIK
jgi:similar to stage IV sporulation protein